MQIKALYREDTIVYAKTVGDGQQRLYVQKVMGRRYILRTAARRGKGVIQGIYLEEDLDYEPYS